IGFYDLPNDYLESFNKRVEWTTKETIQDAFRRRVRPEEMVTVVVGGKIE
ncbi:MAG: insulinase family protein, partial [Gammaproteobacteria bacterium]|nr:insulinase family protein [Gammaproteobacteria bacterium]